MKTIFFFTHSAAEIKNNSNQDPSGFAVNDVTKPIELKHEQRRIVYYFKDDSISIIEEWKNSVIRNISIYNSDSIESIYFFHSQNMTTERIRDYLGLHGKVVEEFTRSGKTEKLWKEIKEIKGVCQGGTINNNEKFIRIFDEIWAKYNLFTKIHSLRYEILSPLVALDLINQAEKESKVIDENTKNDVKNAVKEIKKGDQVNKLCGILECAYQLKSDLNSLMQVENSSSIDHENLKKIAGDLESQVRAFEDKWNLA